MRKIILSDKKNLGLIVLTSVLISVLNVTFSFGLGNITKSAVDSNSSELLTWIGISVSVLVISMLLDILNNNYRKDFCKNCVLEIKKNVFLKIENVPNKMIVEKDEGYFYNLLRENINLVYDDFFASIAVVMSLSIKLLGSLLALIFLDFSLFIIFIVFSSIPILLGRYFDSEVSEKKIKLSEITQNYTSKLIEYLNGITVFKSFNAMESVNSLIESYDSNYEEARSRLGKSTGKAVFFSNALGMLAHLGCMGAAAFYVINFSHPISLITTSTQLLNYIFSPFNAINSNMSLIKSSNSIIKQYTDFFDSEDKLTTQVDIQNPEIAFDNVTFNYGDKQVLTDFNWKINPGTKNIVIGKSGSGKSTIIKLILKYLSPEEGGIYLGSRNLADVGEDSLYQYVSYVPQKPFILNESLRENIISFSKSVSQDYYTILKKCHIEHIDDYLELGYNGGKISGGEAQKVAIARALYSGSQILILDEPTSALDPMAKREIFDLVLNLENITVIVVSHDYDDETLDRFDHVISLSE